MFLQYSRLKVTGPSLGLHRIDIEFTERCNLHCEHCHIRREADDPEAQRLEQSAEWIVGILKDARKLGARALHITGGEVLLRPDFAEAYEVAYDLGYDISVVTNATLLTPCIAALWAGKRPDRLAVSIYGWDKSSYEQVVQSPDAFKLFVRGLDLLAKNNLAFTPLVPAVRLLIDNLDRVRSFVYDKGAGSPPVVSWELIMHSRRDLEGCGRIASLRLAPKEAARLRIRTPGAAIEDIQAIRFRPKQGRRFSGCMFACGGGRYQVAVDPYGVMQPCRRVRAPEALYDLKTGALKEALTVHMPKIRDKLGTNPEFISRCMKCRLRGGCCNCAGTSWIETGTLDAPVDYYCGVMHEEAYMLGLLPWGEKGWTVDPAS